MQTFPFVIWQGKQPLHPKVARLYRVVHRGPARPNRADDVPFSVETRHGQDMMKKINWGQPDRNGAEHEAVHALVHAFGLLLTVDPKKLNLDHPLFCEINLAVAEGREPRGCDCSRPSDPAGQNPLEAR